MKEDSAGIIQAIKNGETQALHQVYLAHKSSFMDWVSARFQFDEEAAQDVWQDVMVIFYENIREGKITSLKSSIRTYLFGIGRFLILERFRKQKREQPMPEDPEIPRFQPTEPAVADAELELNDRQILMKEAIKSLGKNCRELLTLFYYRRFTTESIMAEMGYKNPNVVKSQKLRCMKSLRDMITESFDRDTI